jgi:hypothetical protein
LGSNAGFSGPIEFSIRLMGASAPEETTLYSLVFAPSVLVAGRSNTTFAGATQPAAFAIDAIPDQNAGLAFTVTVRALRAGGQPLATFSGTAVLSGVDVGGGTTPAFVNGVLASQIVMIREQGPASVTVTRGAASGVSNTFSVKGSFSAWRNTRFSESELANPAVSGPAADPGGRGVANLLRYAFNTGMNPPDLSRLPRFGGVTIGGSTFLTISFNRSATADDLEYVVQASGNMQTWQDVQTFTAGLPEVVTVQDTVAVTVATPRYLRVLVRQRPSFGDAAFASLPSNLRMDPSATQPFADYGSRGISNFERYAYGLDFLNPSVSQLPAASIVTKAGGARHLAVTFRRRTEAGASVRYLVQTSTNFGPWSTVATIAPGSPSPVTVEDPVALASQPKFIRVQVVPGTP